MNARQVKVITDIIGELQLPINVGDLIINSLHTGKIYRVSNEDELLKAISVSESFDTIILEDGTYNTSFSVNKSLTIMGSPNAVITSDNLVISVGINNRVNLVGFTVQRTTSTGSVINYWGNGRILGLTIKGGQWGLTLSGYNSVVMYNSISNFVDYGISTTQAGHFIAFNVISADGTPYKDGILISPGVSTGNVPAATTIFSNTFSNIYRGVIIQGTFGIVIQSNIIYATETGVSLGASVGITPIPSSGTKVIYNTIIPYSTTLNNGVVEVNGGTRANYIAGNLISATNPIVVYDSQTVTSGNVIV